MRQSRLGPGGENVLQTIRAKRAEAQGQGIRLIDLSIGEPKGPALLSARQAAAAAVMSDDEAMHAYQYNASPGVPDFAPRFIKAHVQRAFLSDAVDYLPIPGIKPILGLVPLACGCAEQRIAVATMTSPGYPIPADWCVYHPLVTHRALPLNPTEYVSLCTRRNSPGHRPDHGELSPQPVGPGGEPRVAPDDLRTSVVPDTSVCSTMRRMWSSAMLPTV